MSEIKKEKVTHHSDEGGCFMCGCPVYVGDYWFWDVGSDDPCCSQKCAEYSGRKNSFEKTMDENGENWGSAVIPVNW